MNCQIDGINNRCNNGHKAAAPENQETETNAGRLPERLLITPCTIGILYEKVVYLYYPKN